MIRFPSVRRAILAKKTPMAVFVWTLASILVPTLFRLLIDGGNSGAPFVTYFPAIMLASLFLGWRYATITAIGSAIVGNRVFRPELTIFEFESADFIMAGLFAFSCVILINIGETVRKLLHDLEGAHEREVVLNKELRHRAKNMLAMVQSMAAMTFRSSGPDRFLDDFSARVAAMARVTDMADA